MTINQKSIKHSVKKTDLWLPLWVGPYLADTQHLTRDEHGGYFLLLLAYWRNGGPLLDDDKRLASITKSTAKEWKKLKPILSEFFIVADGRWTQKRMEKELAASMANLAQKSLAGKASAEKRWGKVPAHPGNEVETGVMTDAVADRQRQGNSTTTTSTSTTPASLSTTSPKNPHPAEPVIETLGPTKRVGLADSSEACLAMEKAGITDCNPDHPVFISLLSAGATVGELQQAAFESVRRQKGFAYAIGIVVNQRKAASGLALRQGRLLNKQEALEASNRLVGEEWVKKMQQKIEKEMPDEG